MWPAHLGIVDVEGARHTLALTGELDLETAQVLEGAVLHACEAGARHVALDCTGLDFIDSTGLAAIARLRREGIQLSVIHESDIVRRLFELTGVPRVVA
jgi:anti-anti-sigma factor